MELSSAKSMGNSIDITGNKYGRALVISYSHYEKRNAYWNCICDCGKSFKTTGKGLRAGSTQSCGCLAKERRAAGVSKAKTTHGGTKNGKDRRTYRIWTNMKSRCSNPNFDSYKWYGGRGIKVCEKWKSYAEFLADMGDAPEGMTIDRLDGDKDYEPGNCRWSTWTEQQNNRRNNKWIEFNGVKLTQAQWAKKVGLASQTISSRLKSGMSVGLALGLEPARQ